MVDLWRDFWIRETGTGQQVAQLHERYMMMIKEMCAKYLIFKHWYDTADQLYYYAQCSLYKKWSVCMCACSLT